MVRIRKRRRIVEAKGTKPATAQQVWALMETLRAQEFDYDRLRALVVSGALSELLLLSKISERETQLRIARRLLLGLRYNPDLWIDGCVEPREREGYVVAEDRPYQLFSFDPALFSFWTPILEPGSIRDLVRETRRFQSANDAVLAWFSRNLEKIPDYWKGGGSTEYRRILFPGTRYRMGVFERVPALVWDNKEGKWTEDMLDMNSGINDRLWPCSVLLLQSERKTEEIRNRMIETSTFD